MLFFRQIFSNCFFVFVVVILISTTRGFLSGLLYTLLFLSALLLSVACYWFSYSISQSVTVVDLFNCLSDRAMEPIWKVALHFFMWPVLRNKLLPSLLYFAVLKAFLFSLVSCVFCLMFVLKPHRGKHNNELIHFLILLHNDYWLFFPLRSSSNCWEECMCVLTLRRKHKNMKFVK